MKNAYIVFCSPGGSTGHVAHVIADALVEKSIGVHLLDLGTGGDPSRFIELLKAADADDCLFVGSPVYRELAVPPVMNFLGNVPAADGCRAVPFVTWGGATSGIALWQMGQVLKERGYALAGGAEVLGRHSMMWWFDQPVGQGHPDSDDDRQVRNLVLKVVERAARTAPDSIPLATLDYQPETVRTEMKKIEAMIRKRMETFNEKPLTQIFFLIVEKGSRMREAKGLFSSAMAGELICSTIDASALVSEAERDLPPRRAVPLGQYCLMQKDLSTSRQISSIHQR